MALFILCSFGFGTLEPWSFEDQICRENNTNRGNSFSKYFKREHNL
jgi:hypothetical protein